jgi:hypothetical protein
MRAYLTSFILACVLASSPAHADVPGGHLYFGVGASWMVPLPASGQHVWESPLDSERVAISLQLTFEFEHLFLAAAYESNDFGSANPGVSLSSLQVGWIIGTASVAPYLALGLGSLTEDVIDPFDNGSATGGKGPAGIAEVGVLLFRNLRFGRASVMVRAIEPFFQIPRAPSSSTPSNGNNRLPLLTAGFRVFL